MHTKAMKNPTRTGETETPHDMSFSLFIHGQLSNRLNRSPHLASHQAPKPSAQGMPPRRSRATAKKIKGYRCPPIPKNHAAQCVHQPLQERARPSRRRQERNVLQALEAWRSTIPCRPCTKKTPIRRCAYVLSENTCMYRVPKKT